MNELELVVELAPDDGPRAPGALGGARTAAAFSFGQWDM